MQTTSTRATTSRRILAIAPTTMAALPRNILTSSLIVTSAVALTSATWTHNVVLHWPSKRLWLNAIINRQWWDWMLVTLAQTNPATMQVIVQTTIVATTTANATVWITADLITDAAPVKFTIRVTDQIIWVHAPTTTIVTLHLAMVWMAATTVSPTVNGTTTAVKTSLWLGKLLLPRPFGTLKMFQATYLLARNHLLVVQQFYPRTAAILQQPLQLLSRTFLLSSSPTLYVPTQYMKTQWCPITTIFPVFILSWTVNGVITWKSTDNFRLTVANALGTKLKL